MNEKFIIAFLEHEKPVIMCIVDNSQRGFHWSLDFGSKGELCGATLMDTACMAAKQFEPNLPYAGEDHNFEPIIPEGYRLVLRGERMQFGDMYPWTGDMTWCWVEDFFDGINDSGAIIRKV